MDRRKQYAIKELERFEEYIESEIAESRDAYFVDFISRKTKATYSTAVCSAFAALAVNFVWQLVCNYLLSVNPSSLDPTQLELFQGFLIQISFIIVAFSVVAVFLIFYLNRRTIRDLAIEEYALRKRGYLE